jgi:hypothetical protein
MWVISYTPVEPLGPSASGADANWDGLHKWFGFWFWFDDGEDDWQFPTDFVEEAQHLEYPCK